MPLGKSRFDLRQPQRGHALRTNQRIRVPEVRVVDADGALLGVMPTHEALKVARQRGLDLVELNPKDAPPLCKILDFGKYKYDEAKKKSRASRTQMNSELKEIKLRPKTDDHDLDFKSRAARRFIEAAHKVKFTVRFRGREITHPEKAREQLDWLVQKLEDIAVVESRPNVEGRTMTLLVAPKEAVRQRAAQAKVQREKEREKALKEGRTPPPEAQEPELPDDDSDDDDDDDEGPDA
ncbi:MAG TPA: translation initiation factor IF-3 [Polyangiaceae bacterium]|nr:translation initiation factor IF-3 [Polyangiaceae bacterium]